MSDKKPQVSEFSQPKPRTEAPMTVKCFVVPVEAMEQIRDCLREAPYKTAQPIMAQLGTLQIMDVPVKPKPPNDG